MNFNTGILSLNYDVLKIIMLLVVASPGGVIDLAKAMAVSKMFTPFGDDEELLKMANFEYFEFPNSFENCEHVRSLLIRCAEAGNGNAQFFLAQVILVRFSHVVDKYMLPPFLNYFMPEKIINMDSDKVKLTHFELVGLFLRRCSFLDQVYMMPHLQNYLNHFRNGTKTSSKFYECFNSMTSVLRAFVDVGRDIRTLYSPSFLNLSQIQPEMRNARDVLDKLGPSMRYYYFFNRDAELSQLELEELKKECCFMVEKCKGCFDCDHSKKPVNKNDAIVDMGKRIFYYLAFDGPVTQEIDLALDRDGDHLRTMSMQYAKSYYIYKQQAAWSLSDMFFTCQKREAVQRTGQRNVRTRI